MSIHHKRISISTKKGIFANEKRTLTMLTVACINGIIYDTVLIQFIVSDFEFHFMEPLHSERKQGNIQ